MTLSKLIEYQKQNPGGQQIEQTIVIGEEAKDLFCENRHLEVYMGYFNQLPATVHVSNGSDKSNEKLMKTYRLLSQLSDDHLLYVYAIKEAAVPSSSKVALVLASENYQSNLKNLITARAKELFVKVDTNTKGLDGKVVKMFDMSQELQHIVRDIGVTIRRIKDLELSLSSTNLKDIFIQVIDNEYIVKMGIDICEGGEVTDPPAYLARVLKQIFEVAKMKPSDLLSDFVSLLREPILEKKLSGMFLQHPIFLSWDERVNLVYDVASLYTHAFPENVLPKQFTWPKDEDFLKMVHVRRADQTSTFIDFVIFVKDKCLSHPEDLEKHGYTKETFLADVNLKVPYFWIAIGRLVCAPPESKKQGYYKRW